MSLGPRPTMSQGLGPKVVLQRRSHGANAFDLAKLVKAIDESQAPTAPVAVPVRSATATSSSVSSSQTSLASSPASTPSTSLGSTPVSSTLPSPDLKPLELDDDNIPSWRRGSGVTARKASQSSDFAGFDWRHGTKAISSSADLSSSSTPSFDDVHVGQVFYLPQESCVPECSIFRSVVRPDSYQPWAHPVVVTSKQRIGETVTFNICTSFSSRGSKGIPAHKTPDARRKLVLCDNHDSDVEEHDNTRRLTLVDGSEKFTKATYINFHNDEFVIESKYLRTYTTLTRKPIIFSTDSLQRIIAKDPFGDSCLSNIY